jgi:hypothetical protein
MAATAFAAFTGTGSNGALDAALESLSGVTHIAIGAALLSAAAQPSSILRSSTLRRSALSPTPIVTVGKAPGEETLTLYEEFCEHFNDPPVYLAAGAGKWTKDSARNWTEDSSKPVVEPSDPLTQERLARLIEVLELQLRGQRKLA